LIASKFILAIISYTFHDVSVIKAAIAETTLAVAQGHQQWYNWYSVYTTSW